MREVSLPHPQTFLLKLGRCRFLCDAVTNSQDCLAIVVSSSLEDVRLVVLGIFGCKVRVEPAACVSVSHSRRWSSAVTTHELRHSAL